jgi:hypothetical protein
MALVFDDSYHPMLIIDDPQESLGIRLWCEKCGKELEEVYFSHNEMRDTLVFIAKCHGEIEQMEIDKELLRNGKSKTQKRSTRSTKKQPEERNRK